MTNDEGEQRTDAIYCVFRADTRKTPKNCTDAARSVSPSAHPSRPHNVKDAIYCVSQKQNSSAYEQKTPKDKTNKTPFYHVETHGRVSLRVTG